MFSLTNADSISRVDPINWVSVGEKHITIYVVCAWVCPFPLSYEPAWGYPYFHSHSHRPTMCPIEFQVPYMCYLIIHTINLQDRNDYPHFTDEEHWGTERLTTKSCTAQTALVWTIIPPAPPYLEDKNPILPLFVFAKPKSGSDWDTQCVFAGSVSLYMLYGQNYSWKPFLWSTYISKNYLLNTYYVQGPDQHWR